MNNLKLSKNNFKYILITGLIIILALIIYNYFNKKNNGTKESFDLQCDKSCLELIKNDVTKEATINYIFDEPVSGFQFDINDTASITTVTHALENFTTDNNQTRVLGYSMTRNQIPKGSGTLLKFNFGGTLTELKNIILSDSDGEYIDNTSPKEHIHPTAAPTPAPTAAPTPAPLSICADERILDGQYYDVENTQNIRIVNEHYVSHLIDFVNINSVNAGYIKWNLDCKLTGNYTFTLEYANGSRNSRPLRLQSVNNDGDDLLGIFHGSNSGGWKNYSTENLDLVGVSDIDNLRLYTTGIGPNVKSLTIRPIQAPVGTTQAPVGTTQAPTAAPTPAPLSICADERILDGENYDVENTQNIHIKDSNGEPYLIDFDSKNADGYIKWNLDCKLTGYYTFTLRYANGSRSDRPLELQSVNNDGDDLLGIFHGESSGKGWSDYFTQSINKYVNDITNLRLFTEDSYHGPNVASLTIRPCVGCLTTQAPVGTTQAPVGTTQAPIGTTQAPVGTTQAPVGTTQAPVGTTQAPIGTTQAPVGTTQAPVGTTQAPGDVNGDGITNIIDVVLTINHILGRTTLTDPQKIAAADINSDGIINIVDVVAMINIILNN